MAPQPTENIGKPADAAKFCAFLNGSYHADREAVLDRRHRWMMFLVIALGASSVLEPFGPEAKTYSGVATALLGAVDLAFGFSTRARRHSYLRKEYFRIAAELARGTLSPVEADAKMMELAAEEEPIFKAAHALAENWATQAVYGSNEPQPCLVSWWRRQLRHWLLMTEQDFTVRA